MFPKVMCKKGPFFEWMGVDFWGFGIVDSQNVNTVFANRWCKTYTTTLACLWHNEATRFNKPRPFLLVDPLDRLVCVCPAQAVFKRACKQTCSDEVAHLNVHLPQAQYMQALWLWNACETVRKADSVVYGSCRNMSFFERTKTQSPCKPSTKLMPAKIERNAWQYSGNAMVENFAERGMFRGESGVQISRAKRAAWLSLGVKQSPFFEFRLDLFLNVAAWLFFLRNDGNQPVYIYVEIWLGVVPSDSAHTLVQPSLSCRRKLSHAFWAGGWGDRLLLSVVPTKIDWSCTSTMWKFPQTV